MNDLYSQVKSRLVFLSDNSRKNMGRISLIIAFSTPLSLRISIPTRAVAIANPISGQLAVANSERGFYAHDS